MCFVLTSERTTYIFPYTATNCWFYNTYRVIIKLEAVRSRFEHGTDFLETNSYILIIAMHQPENDGDARSAGWETAFDRGVSGWNYRPAITQPSGVFVLALIFGYARLMWETKKALYTRVLQRYPAASEQPICEYALEQSVSACALGSSEEPNYNKVRLLLQYQIPYLQLSSPNHAPSTWHSQRSRSLNNKAGYKL
jgi:hypothetical protein